MFVLKSLIFCAAWLCLSCQHQGPTTTPVPILKQINRQNDDGSYSYGYEAADGSFKIETKYPNGDVAGKYGYVDGDGKTREISYGASSKRGFEPQGSGIMVPPPTLNDSPSNALTDGQEDDGQYREDPKIYEDPKYNGKSQGRPAFRQYHKAQTAQPEYQPEPQQQPTYQQQYQPPQHRSAPLYSQQTSLYNQDNSFNQQSLFSEPQQNLFSQPQRNAFSQSPQQFPQERPQSQVYHQQPQFSYSAFTPQYTQPQYQNQAQYQPQYQSQSPYASSHPALQNYDPNTGSYTINFTGK